MAMPGTMGLLLQPPNRFWMAPVTLLTALLTALPTLASAALTAPTSLCPSVALLLVLAAGGGVMARP